MQKRSLGLIETLGYVPAIEAADAASKAAHVRLLGYEEVRAGLITVKLVGDVAAVKAAVSAASAAAAVVGTVISQHVIARPDRQLSILHRPPPPAPPPPSEPQSPPAAEVQPTAGDGTRKEPEPAAEERIQPTAPSPSTKAKKAKAGAGKQVAKGTKSKGKKKKS